MMDIDEQYLELAEELETLRAENARLIAERDRLQTKFDLLVKDTEKLQESYNQLRVDRFKIFHEDECWIYDENEDNNLHSLVCPVVIKASVLQSVLEENKRFLAEREAIMKQEPVAYEHTFAISDDGAKFTIYTTKKEHQEAESTRPLYAHLLPAQQIPEGYALADKTELNKIHRDLDSCQKVIWLAGGFDPSYCKDAQESLKLIDAMLSASQPKGELI